MKVTLIRARTGNTPDPPLGLLILAACLKERGHQVQVLDPGPEATGVESQVIQFQPDLIGFSMLTTQALRTLELQSQIRAALKNVRTCAGGIHPTALPEWTLRTFGFDFVVIGEGEVTFPEAVDALSSGRDLSKIDGLARLVDGEIKYAPARALITNLDSIPIPDREIIDFTRYLRPPGNIRGKFLKRATSIITSRGCPFGCIFCSSHALFGREVRRRSIPNVMHEIEHLIKIYKIDGLWFLDDTLVESKEWLLELCNGLKATGLVWGCQAHVKRADEEIFKRMKESGCQQLEFGVESGSKRMLKRLRKGSDPDEIRRAFRICSKLGLRTLANFMIGIPDETEDDAMASLALAKEIKPDHVVVTFTTPLPGSDLYEEACRKNWTPPNPEFSERWIIRQTEAPAVICALDAETLKRLRKKFDNAFFWTNIKEYFQYPEFVLEIAAHMMRHPLRYAPGFIRTIRTGRLGHLVESIWEQYNQVF
jgi:anaerobic magnesium-protoporphyrin IX monomethyl ester cyclase